MLGQSQDPEVIKRDKLLLNGKKVNLLFIDGDHNIAKEDFHNYSQFVADGGWIAFHDILDKGLQVRSFWEEVKHQYESWEFDVREQPEEKRRSHRGFEKMDDGIGLMPRVRNAVSAIGSPSHVHILIPFKSSGLLIGRILLKMDRSPHSNQLTFLNPLAFIKFSSSSLPMGPKTTFFACSRSRKMKGIM